MRGAGLALAIALGLPLLPGCGGDSQPDSGAIEVRDFEFAPAERTVSLGEKVTWDNVGDQIHNVKGKGFFSDGMDPGESYSHAFAKSGRHDYTCTLHPQMKGTVLVE